jgi:hypothetical protein
MKGSIHFKGTCEIPRSLSIYKSTKKGYTEYYITGIYVKGSCVE